MRVVQLANPFPAPPKPKTPQCCVPVPEPAGAAWPDWRKKRYEARGLDYTCCTRSSVAEIDGKPYCSLHAGQVALAHLLRETAA